MRVITGTARGRNLLAPAGTGTRPTSALVKEAIFSAIQFDVEGAHVLDLFAGSGQMGIESLSRGARRCVLVDHSKDAQTVLRKNLVSTGLSQRAVVVASDAFAFLRGYGGEPFDIAFLDPPYDTGMLEKALPLVAEKMCFGGMILCECGLGQELPNAAGAIPLKKRYRHGKTIVGLFSSPDEDDQPDWEGN